MKIITSTESENAVLDELTGEYQTYSEMLVNERRFLNSLLLRKKPLKVLEVGVSAGSSSAIILNAIKNSDSSRLHSIDLLDYYYRDRSLACGFVVDGYPELKKKHMLYSGALACAFLDKIGNGIDFCFIDTAHVLPGEVIDFLMVLPYLAKNCMLVFHDTQLHTDSKDCNCFSNALLMSTIRGEKLIPAGMLNRNPDSGGSHHSFPTTAFANIGGMTLDVDATEHIWDIMNLLTLKWAYMLSEADYLNVRAHFSRFFDRESLELFEAIYLHQVKRDNEKWENESSSPMLWQLKRSFKRHFYNLCLSMSSGEKAEHFKAKRDKYSKR